MQHQQGFSVVVDPERAFLAPVAFRRTFGAHFVAPLTAAQALALWKVHSASIRGEKYDPASVDQALRDSEIKALDSLADVDPPLVVKVGDGYRLGGALASSAALLMRRKAIPARSAEHRLYASPAAGVAQGDELPPAPADSGSSPPGGRRGAGARSDRESCLATLVARFLSRANTTSGADDPTGRCDVFAAGRSTAYRIAACELAEAIGLSLPQESCVHPGMNPSEGCTICGHVFRSDEGDDE